MKIIYARGNLNRKQKYLISTIICQNNNTKFVRKYASSSEAVSQLLNLQNIYNTLSKITEKNIYFPKIIDQKKNYIDFEYIDLPSLELIIEEAIISHQFEKSRNYLLIFKKIVSSIPTKLVDPYKNKGFIDIFDPKKNFDLNSKERCILPGLLDLNLDNLLYNSKNSSIYLIDWEWTYDFPISSNFVLFRSLFYLSYKLQSLITTFCSSNFPCFEVFNNFFIPVAWWNLFSFSQKDIEKFFIYENNFQNSVNSLQVDIDKTIFPNEKKDINKRISLNLNTYVQSLLPQKSLELESFNSKLRFSKEKGKRLKNILNKVKSTFF